jgi:hypothetical protein
VCLDDEVSHVFEIVEGALAPFDDSGARITAATMKEVVVGAVQYVFVHLCSQDASNDRCSGGAVKPVAEALFQSFHDNAAQCARLASVSIGTCHDLAGRSFDFLGVRGRGQVGFQYGELVLNGTSVAAGGLEVAHGHFGVLDELAHDSECLVVAGLAVAVVLADKRDFGRQGGQECCARGVGACLARLDEVCIRAIDSVLSSVCENSMPYESFKWKVAWPQMLTMNLSRLASDTGIQ